MHSPEAMHPTCRMCQHASTPARQHPPTPAPPRQQPPTPPGQHPNRPRPQRPRPPLLGPSPSGMQHEDRPVAHDQARPDRPVPGPARRRVSVGTGMSPESRARPASIASATIGSSCRTATPSWTCSTGSGTSGAASAPVLRHLVGPDHRLAVRDQSATGGGWGQTAPPPFATRRRWTAPRTGLDLEG